MNSKINFSRDRYKNAPTCPCGKSNRDGKFSPDKKNSSLGYCHSCLKFFADPKIDFQQSKYEIPIKPEISVHPTQTMKDTYKKYNENNFIKFCKVIFRNHNIIKHAKIYGIGTSLKFGGGSTIFWQQDMQQRVRAGKIMQYNSRNGKRIKSNEGQDISWVHKATRIKRFNLQQCLFGLHLVSGTSKTVAIVESEKTAFIMSIVDPTKIWLATGGKGNFKYQLLKPLISRNIIAFPDKGEYLTWKKIAENLKIYNINIRVLNIIECKDRPKGWDLADEYLLRIENQSII